MDRRVIAGLVGVVLAGGSEARAMQGPLRDPSAQPPVGMSPLPSIADSINSTTGFSGAAPPVRPVAPINPTAPDPSARSTRTPDTLAPTSITPMTPIDESINREFPSPAGRGPATIRPRRSRAPAPAADPRPIRPAGPAPAPAPLPDLLPADPPPADAAAPPSAGRPAPFAGRSPEVPRPQAVDPGVAPAAGRLAPMADERPRSARPQASPDGRPRSARPQATADGRPRGPRPQSPPANAPTYRPAEASAVPAAMPPEPGPPPASMPAMPPLEGAPIAIPAGLPPLEPSGSPGPIDPTPPTGADPLQGTEPATPLPPPEVVAAPEPSPAPAPVAVDPAVKRTSQDPAAIKMTENRKDLPYATLRAAAVGEEVITIEELNQVVDQKLEEFRDMAPPSAAEKRQFTNMIAAQALERMIDERLIIQEARRRMKNPKAQDSFNEFVDKAWREEEIPPLLRKTASTNEYDLKRKLAEQGKSYDAMKEAYRRKHLSREFLNAEIRNKVTSDLAEQRAYYNAHLKDFEQPARFTWREVEVNVARNPSRDAARQKAETILARLARNDDFAALARSASDGPTAAQGGLYPDMRPGGYGIPVVNDELNRLPVGQVSPILETPNSFHIVRVESRREGGPLRFDEVQDKIKPLVLEQNYGKAVEAYLTRLRSRTLIRSMFDNTESDPRLVRRNDPSVRPAAVR